MQTGGVKVVILELSQSFKRGYVVVTNSLRNLSLIGIVLGSIIRQMGAIFVVAPKDLTFAAVSAYFI